MRFHVPGLSAVLFLTAAAFAFQGCGSGDAPKTEARDLTVFHASGMTPVLEEVRADCLRELNINLRTEASGSQVVCRKVSGLNRDCDLVMLADAALVARMLKGVCSWRLDFANDEIVLAVGTRAPNVAQAERDWVAALQVDSVRLARVDESLGPIGYRTLMTWKLQQERGSAGLFDALSSRCGKVVEHVSQLTPLLKSGEIDYAFAYRSICVAHDVRFISLAPEINLGAPDADYSGAVVSFPGPAPEGEKIQVHGAPITWTASIPARSSRAELAAKFLRWLLADKRGVLSRNGFRPLQRPRYFGPEKAFEKFDGLAERRGGLGKGS